MNKIEAKKPPFDPKADESAFETIVRRTLNVYEMNEGEYWADYSKEEAIANFVEHNDRRKDEIESVKKLSDRQVKKYKCDMSESGEDGPKLTFKQIIDEMTGPGHVAIARWLL